MPVCSPIRLILAYMLRYMIRSPRSLTSKAEFSKVTASWHQLTSRTCGRMVSKFVGVTGHENMIV